MKKKIKKVVPKVITGLIAFNSPILFLGGALGYFSGMYFGGTKEHPQIIKSIVFNIGNYKLQLHHWLILPVGLVSAASFDFFLFSSPFFFGFLGGVAFHDIYLDPNWKKVLTKK